MIPHKRVHSPTDYGSLTTDQARKKYISEQFAEQLNAMSLYNNSNQKQSSPTANFDLSIARQQEQQDRNQDPMSITSETENTKDWTRTNMVQTNVHGNMLPFEQRPGESKLRIPDFLLQPTTSSSSGISDVRDLVKYSPLTWRHATAAEEAEINSNCPTETNDSDDEDNIQYDELDDSAMDID
ncbi:hypothetical protein INT45_006731 [Circinella minor]|uniref:Uncharacterized protein n=1 Tax=Circinella minor TaxID=1195481 RepID=A0A8H7RV24_9FUNG|nr:hypothetical protein INT45_006731 [Circinella minor]